VQAEKVTLKLKASNEKSITSGDTIVGVSFLFIEPSTTEPDGSDNK